MPKPTIAQTLIEGLLHIGYKQVTSKYSSKYKYFVHTTHPAIGPNGRPIYIFVGTNGALRRGQNASNSLSCSDSFKLLIQKAYTDSLEAKANAFNDL